MIWLRELVTKASAIIDVGKALWSTIDEDADANGLATGIGMMILLAGAIAGAMYLGEK